MGPHRVLEPDRGPEACPAAHPCRRPGDRGCLQPARPHPARARAKRGPATLRDVARGARLGLPDRSTAIREHRGVQSRPQDPCHPDHADGTAVLFNVATHARRPAAAPAVRANRFPDLSRDIHGMAFKFRPGRQAIPPAQPATGSIVLWDLAMQAPIGRPLRPHPTLRSMRSPSAPTAGCSPQASTTARWS